MEPDNFQFLNQILSLSLSIDGSIDRPYTSPFIVFFFLQKNNIYDWVAIKYPEILKGGKTTHSSGVCDFVSLLNLMLLQRPIWKGFHYSTPKKLNF